VINLFLGCLFGGFISAAAFGSATTGPARRLAITLGLGMAAFGAVGTAVILVVSQ